MSFRFRSVKKFVKITFILIGIIFIALPMFLIALLQIPIIEKKVTQKIQSELSDKFRTQIKVEKVGLSYPFGLRLNNIHIQDQRKDTLVYAEGFQVNVSLLHLVKKEVFLTKLAIENATVSIYRLSGSDEFNYSFITNILASDSDKEEKSSWRFNLSNLYLKKVNFSYTDAPRGVNIDSKIPSLTALLNFSESGKGHLAIKRIRGDRLFFSIDINDSESLQTLSSSSNSNFSLDLSHAEIKHSYFLYNDLRKKEALKGIDYNRLNFSNINGVVKDVFYSDSLFTMEVDNASLSEKSGLNVHKLSGLFKLDKHNILLTVRSFITSNSNIDNSINATIPLTGNTLDKISFKAKLKNDLLAMKDLSLFFPELDAIIALKNKRVLLSGTLQGRLGDFLFQDMVVEVDAQNKLVGNFSFKGLPDLSKLSVILNASSFSISSTLLSSFYLPADTSINLKGLGTIKGTAFVKGPLLKPQLDISITSAAGAISYKGSMEGSTAFSYDTIQGTVKATQFDVSKVYQTLGIGKVNLVLRASLTKTTIDSFYLNASSIEYNHYQYKNVVYKGNLKNDSLASSFSINDPNANSQLVFNADLKKKKYTIVGDINKLDLYATQLYSFPSIIGFNLNASFSGTSVDSLVGYANFKDLSLARNDMTFMLDSIFAEASMHDAKRKIQILSPLFQGNITGKYSIYELSGIFDYLINQYFTNKKLPIKDEFKNTEEVEVHFNGGNLSPLVSLFYPEVKSLDNIDLFFYFNKSNDSIELTSTVESVNILDHQFNHSSLLLNGNADSLSYTLSSTEYVYGTSIHICSPSLIGRYVNGVSYLNLKLHDQKSPTRISVDGIVHVLNDSIVVDIPEAVIEVDNTQWKLSNNSQITYANNFFELHNLEFINKEQRISLYSSGSKESNSIRADLIKVNLFQLTKLAGFTTYEMKGDINGTIDLENRLSNQKMQLDLGIDSFMINNQLVGNLHFKVSKSLSDPTVNALINLIGNENQASIEGTYNLKNKSLNGNLSINHMALNPIQPFIQSFAYRINGAISGQFKISGYLDKPAVVGELIFLNENEIGINATHSIYKFKNEHIRFKENAVVFSGFKILDPLNNMATVNGYISHTNFSDFNFSLLFDTDHFQIINSSYSEDVALYGKLLAEMHVELKGPLDDLKIKLGIKALKGSQLFVPLISNVTSNASPSYIHFNEIESEYTGKSIMVDSSVTVPNVSTAIDFSRYNLLGQLKVTKETEINIIVDPVNGDMITARGDGFFTFDFDSRNNLNVFGTYTIDKGSYSFSFVNLIKKDFKIDKGSTISWAGDPTEATLNIKAKYETRASRYELLESDNAFISKEQEDAARRPLPVNVYVLLKGSMTSPDITFDIEVPEGNDPFTGSQVVQKINQIKSNPNELNKQVFSLIVTNRFIAESGSTIKESGSNVALNQVNQSVSKILNSQLNKMSDEYLSGVDINVTLQSLDQATYGTFAQNAQITASKKLSNRITVSAGGNVNINSNYGSSQFAGDYTIYYRVNPSGAVNLKFFRTNIQNIYTTSLYTQQGFSINYKREYNKWAHILRSSKRREEEE